MMEENITIPHHITSHHITSHHIASHHITSHNIISHYITSHHITSHHTTPDHITSHHIISYHIISHHITSHYIMSHHVTSHHITPHQITITSHYHHITPHHTTPHRTTLHSPAWYATIAPGGGEQSGEYPPNLTSLLKIKSLTVRVSPPRYNFPHCLTKYAFTSERSFVLKSSLRIFSCILITAGHWSRLTSSIPFASKWGRGWGSVSKQLPTYLRCVSVV